MRRPQPVGSIGNFNPGAASSPITFSHQPAATATAGAPTLPSAAPTQNGTLSNRRNPPAPISTPPPNATLVPRPTASAPSLDISDAAAEAISRSYAPPVASQPTNTPYAGAAPAAPYSATMPVPSFQPTPALPAPVFQPLPAQPAVATSAYTPPYVAAAAGGGAGVPPPPTSSRAAPVEPGDPRTLGFGTDQGRWLAQSIKPNGGSSNPFRQQRQY